MGKTHLKTARTAADTAYSVTPTARQILGLLYSTAQDEQPGWTADELSESLGRRRQTVVSTLARLRADGLVDRTWDHRGEFGARPSSQRF